MQQSQVSTQLLSHEAKNQIPVQTYSNHRRIHPPFHYFAAPLAMLTCIAALVNAILFDGNYTHWVVAILTVNLVVLTGLLRTYPIKVQTRLIRLETILRYERLSGRSFEELEGKLNMAQLTALRFAGDEEFVSLLEEAAASETSPEAIKRSIRHWRSDTWRV